ncbi:MAG: hypothetical protein H6738_05275 [Alphaproteobacteria bacterium]|nr:hypothetical protein [Alphaproteobacteria bacterium]MCB9696178.1 hypothetical protein [Alphaproteobacteria bacterium]
MRVSALLVLAAACAPIDLDAPVEEALPEGWDEVSAELGRQGVGVGLQFSQGALVPDTDVDFTVSGVAPGDLVRFLYSTTGTGAGPCVQQLGGLCLGLRSPVQQLDTAVADASGTAAITFYLPANAPQIFVFTQAVVDRGPASVATNTITAPILSGSLDNDGDGYCGGTVCADPATLPGDCHDGDPAVHPGVTGFHAQPYALPGGGSSYDWDCDGVERLERPQEYDCTPNGGLFPTCPYTPGYTSGVPACGDTANWGAGCTELPLLGLPFCTSTSGSQVTQRCR